METQSIKALANNVLRGNLQGNHMETLGGNHGNFGGQKRGKSFHQVSTESKAKNPAPDAPFNEKFRISIFDKMLRQVMEAYTPDKEKWRRHQEAGGHLDKVWLKARKGGPTREEFMKALTEWAFILFCYLFAADFFPGYFYRGSERTLT